MRTHWGSSVALKVDCAMEFFGSYSFLTILIESVKLLPKNGRLMAFIALFSILLSSCFFFLFSFSLQSMVADMMVTYQQFIMPDPSSFNPNSFNSSDPSSFPPQTGFDLARIASLLNHVKADVAIILAVEIAAFLVFFTIFFSSIISTILVSAMSYSAKYLSLKELFSMIWRTWTRPLITNFYISGLSIGYFAIVLMVAAPLWIYPNLPTFWVAIFVGIPAFLLHLYLSVPWILSIVVSVVEEGYYGMEALGKAAALVKGKRLHGFLFNIFYNLFGLIIFQGFKMLPAGNKWFTITLLASVSLMNIFMAVAYTVFYFGCKMQDGEEIELHGSTVQYAKLPTSVLANDMP